MSIPRRCIFFCYILPITLFLSLSTLAQDRPRRSVFIIADGIPADVIERLDLPNLQAIAKTGAYKRAFVGGTRGGYNQTPTVSAPGYNDLLTGTWANKHNVWDNEIPAPNYNYPTIFRLYKTAYPSGKTAVYSTWTDNLTKLVGEGLPATDRIHVDYPFAGYEKDTIRFPHDTASRYLLAIDEWVMHEADSMIRREGPALSWIYLEYTDDVGHAQGTGTAFDQSVLHLDQQIGLIRQAVEYRQIHYKEDWQIIITTDHGRDSVDGKEHGDQSKRERTTWMVTNIAPLNRYGRTYDPAIVDILPTIAWFLKIPIPENQRRELDGIPFAGPVSLAAPSIRVKNEWVEIRWKAMEEKGNTKIWVSAANGTPIGKTDNYQLVGTAPLKDETIRIPISRLPPSDIYKFVIEGQHNTVGQWLQRPVPKP